MTILVYVFPYDFVYVYKSFIIGPKNSKFKYCHEELKDP